MQQVFAMDCHEGQYVFFFLLYFLFFFLHDNFIQAYVVVSPLLTLINIVKTFSAPQAGRQLQELLIDEWKTQQCNVLQKKINIFYCTI